MVATSSPPERHEGAYASVRVAPNLGVTIGPADRRTAADRRQLVSTLWFGTLVLAGSASGSPSATSRAAARTRPKDRPQRGSFAVIIRDSPFLFFMLASVFATMTYVATETLLPISSRPPTTCRLRPVGLLMILNPLFVTIFQLRLTRWTAACRPR